MRARVNALATLDQPLPLLGLSPESFERFCCDFLRLLYPGAEVTAYGHRGSKQHGVDVQVVLSVGQIYGFQCKRHAQFGPAKIKAAVKAMAFPCSRKFLFLGRDATSKARGEIRKHRGWKLWDVEDISGKFRNLPGVDKARLVNTFFRGQERTYLGEDLASPWQTVERFFAPFHADNQALSHAWDLVGRRKELQQLESWVASGSSPLLVLTGTGGCGKSRLLKEFVERIKVSHPGLAIHFLSPQAPTAKSLEDLGDGRCLLVCDDAHGRQDLRPLFDHLAEQRHPVQALVALRPYGRNAVFQQAQALSPSRTPEVALAPLRRAEARKLAQAALERWGGIIDLADDLARQTLDCPLATVLGARIIAESGAHPVFLRGERAFRDELIPRIITTLVGGVGSGPDEALIKECLGALALLQPIADDGHLILQGLAAISGCQPYRVNQVLTRLRDAGILVRNAGKSRLVPDLLADFLIEDLCMTGDGISTGFAERVFDASPTDAAENILRNFGQLDWRRSNGDTRQSRLLDQLWGRLHWQDDYQNLHVKAAIQVAFFQPAQALAFVDRLIGEGHFGDDLVHILTNVAYNLAHLPGVCSRLWSLALQVPAGRGKQGSPALQALGELAFPYPAKPLEAITTTVDFLISLLPVASNWREGLSPLDALGSALAVEGHTSHGTVRGVTLSGFLVDPHILQPTRRKVISALVGLLTHSDHRRAVKAAEFLHSALRYPMGMFGAAVPDLVRAEWTLDFKTTLEELNELLNERAVSPVVLVAIARSVCWFTQWGCEVLREPAQRILALLGQDIQIRTVVTLMDPWGHLQHQSLTEEGAELQRVERERLARDLTEDLKDPGEVLLHLEACLLTIQSETGKRVESADPVFHAVFGACPDVARRMVELVPVGQFPGLEPFLVSALAFVLVADEDFAERVIRQSQDGTEGCPDLEAVANAYGWVRPKGGYGPFHREVLRQIVRSDRSEVFIHGARAAALVSREDPSLATELLTTPKLAAHPQAIPSYFLWLTHEESCRFGELSEDQVGSLLDGLLPLMDLEPYQIQAFLAKALSHFPDLTLSFLHRRVERQFKDDDVEGYRYRPIAAGPYQQVALNLLRLEDGQERFLALLDWALLVPRDSRFINHFTSLIQALCGPFDPSVLEALVGKADGATEYQMDCLCALISEAPSGFVFDHRVLASRFIESAQQLGERAQDDAMAALYRATTGGSRSGTPGEPFPEDLILKQRAEEALGSPEIQESFRELLRRIAERAEAAIHRQLADGEYMRQQEEMEEEGL